MGEPRIIDIELDERTIIRRSDEIEQERKVAIFDLLEGNFFKPEGQEGPFRILLRIEDNRLAIVVKDEEGRELETIRLGLARFKRPVRDYFAICESYFKAVRSDSPKGLGDDRHGPPLDPQRGGRAAPGMPRRQGRAGFRHGAAAVHPHLRAAHQIAATCPLPSFPRKRESSCAAAGLDSRFRGNDGEEGREKTRR